MSVPARSLSVLARGWCVRAPRAAALALLILLAPLSCSKSEPPPPAPGGSPGAPASSGPASTGQKVTIQIVTNGLSPFWDPMAVGMRRAAEKYGCDADWQGPTTAQIPEQRQLVEAAIARKVDGLAVSAIEASAITPVLDQAADKGILVITFDSDAPKSKRLVYIGTNNYNAGKAAGEAAVKLLPQGGKVVGFVGNRSAENARQREEGFRDAVKGHGIELVEVREDNKDVGRARKNVEDAIQAFKDAKAFLGLYSYNGPAIADAVSAAGIRDRVKVITFDAEPKTIQALQEGKVDVTVVQKPYDFGYRAVELLYKMKTKGVEAARAEEKVPADGLVDTGVELVTPANVAAFKKKLDDLGVKSS
jgi:ribose transport system substrate-binding protein